METYGVWVISNIMIIIMFVLAYYVNNASNNGIIFGVRIQKKYQKDEKIKVLDKEYKRLNIILFSIYTLIINILFAVFINSNEVILATITIVSIVGVLILDSIPFIIYYKKMKKLKKDNKWNYKSNNVVVVDTTLRKPRKNEKFKIINSKYFLLLFIFPIIMIVVTIFKYNSLPEIITVPNMTFKEIQKNTIKGALTIFQFPIAQIFMAGLFYFINNVIANSKVDLNSGSIETAVVRKKKFRRIGSIFMLITGIEIIALFSILQLAILYSFDITIINIVMISVLMLTMLIFMFVFIKIGQGGKNLGFDTEEDNLYKDDDDKWILGSIYFNKDDKAWMVEKRVGIGWTINFASPTGIIVSIATLVLIVVMVIVGIIVG